MQERKEEGALQGHGGGCAETSGGGGCVGQQRLGQQRCTGKRLRAGDHAAA
jgi:hypothetical protein